MLSGAVTLMMLMAVMFLMSHLGSHVVFRGKNVLTQRKNVK